MTWADMVGSGCRSLLSTSAEAATQATYDAKYAGYVASAADRHRSQQRAGGATDFRDFDYEAVPHLRAEAREKLARVRPADLAQAARISGITPADLSVLMIHLESRSAAKAG